MNDIILKQSVTENPLYVYLEDTFKCFMYTLIHNVKLIKINDVNGSINHAGDVYNNIFMSNQTISDDDMNKLAIDFKFITETNNKLKNYVFEDPITNMFEMCKYFFIPIRLDTDSLQDNMKYKSLKVFITAVSVLAFNTIFISRYSTVINTISTLQKIADMIVNNASMLERIEKLSERNIIESIGNLYNSNNSTQIFIRTLGNIFIQISIEVIKRYNPCITECIKINPNYNGEWVNPFDPLFNEQIADIRKLEKLVKT